MMTNERQRAEFETWLYLDQTKYDPGRMSKQEIEIAKLAYQAGRAALQSQDREDAERLEWLVEAMGRLDMDEGHRGWFILERDTSRYVVEDCKTFREAIDHARRVERES